uniref:Carboxylesterase n=1 Tax=Pieris rapae TaxID=64459 RepID=A0A1U9X1Y4_PIERA|nr:carboxylesterase [Pieris rapae]
MGVQWRWVVLSSLWLAQLVKQPTPIINVSSGLLRGRVSTDGTHLRYNGIPYALIPDRFQNPQPAQKWEGVLDAVNENIRCAQRFSKAWITGYEDCLTLNVYTPLHLNRKAYPVMVYIHGGGFRDGSGSPFLYGPEYLVKNGVILVTLNYRLEVLGFLCLGIKEAPGNMGLKDQVEALRWVKQNIKQFNGDPDNITLFGESAGSASVLYHIVSPMSKNLFNRAIMQSGSAISPWSMQLEPIKTAFKLAEQMGYKPKDVYEVLQIFKKKTIVELLGTRVPRREGDTILSENIFVPCIEEVINGMEQMITDSPYNIIRNGSFNKVPIMMGFNSAEGFMFVGKENDTTISKFNVFDSLPRDLEFPNALDKITTAQKLTKVYFGNMENAKDLDLLAKYEGDAGIVYPVIFTADLLIRNMDKPVFVYKFARDGWMNLLKLLYGFVRYSGATHADELFYLFKPEVTLPMSFLEQNVIHKMTTMWTNFAKFENPIPRINKEFLIKWEPINPIKPELLVIDTEFSIETLWNDEGILLWNQTYKEFRRKN